MTRQHDEKRSYIRMALDCPVHCTDLDSGRSFDARAQDLSGAGLGFVLERALSPGTRLEVRIEPGTPVTPPLHAVVEVVRVAPADPAGYRIGTAIREMCH